MKILITGANGQIGWELMRIHSHHELIGLTREQLDITHNTQVLAVVDHYRPDIVINTAAYTAVDKAEEEQALAFAVNHKGAANLAKACRRNNSLLIHLSTDYVFSGAQQHPYRETDSTQPINVYGASKLAGEQAVQAILENYIILRVSSVFGEHGGNFVKTILRLAGERVALQVVADNLSCPTAAKDIAENIFIMIDALSKTAWRDYTGIYHFCSNEPVSWYEFASIIVTQAAQRQQSKLAEIKAVSSAQRPARAQRPAYSVLATHKIQRSFPVRICSWRPALTQLLNKLCYE